jgi:hypothetical protein
MFQSQADWIRRWNLTRKDKVAEAPPVQEEPQEAPIPSRAVLLNRFASLQEKVSKLTDSLILTKDAMMRTAITLRETYGIVVSDAVHTTPTRLVASPVPIVAAPARIEDIAEVVDELPAVAPEDNPMLKAAAVQGIQIGKPRTAPASEAEIEEIRRNAAVDPKDDGAKGFSASIDKTFSKAVRDGLGKR